MNGRTVHYLRNAAFACLLVYTAILVFRGGHAIHGDGVEYILQTQSIALHGKIRIEDADLREHWNRTNPYGFTLQPPRTPAPSGGRVQAGGHWGGLYADNRGDYRYYHFWAYSLAAAPIYLLLHAVAGAPFEYHAFRILNGLLLLAMFAVVWRRSRSWTALTLMALMLYSPLVPYTD